MNTDSCTGRTLLDVIEAALFVGAKPLSADDLAKAIPGLTPQDFHNALRKIQSRYRSERRPYAIVRQQDGFVLQLVEPLRSELLQRIRSQQQVKLNRTAIDVLSVVAYRQPIEKPAIHELLGLDATATLRQLVRRGLLKLQNDANSTAKYVTTDRFLEIFGLDSLDDLPSSDDLERL